MSTLPEKRSCSGRPVSSMASARGCTSAGKRSAGRVSLPFAVAAPPDAGGGGEATGGVTVASAAQERGRNDRRRARRGAKVRRGERRTRPCLTRHYCVGPGGGAILFRLSPAGYW